MGQEIAVDRPWQAAYPEGVPYEVTARYRLIGDIAGDRARATPDKVALTCVLPNGMKGALTFAQVNELSDAFAVWLREEIGLKAGDRVAIQVPNGLSYPVCAFGVFKAGGILVNINPLYTAKEASHSFSDAGVAVLIVVDLFSDRTVEALKIAPVRNVVLTEAADFFPTMERMLVGFVQKYVRKEVPKANFPFTRLRDAIARGRARKAKGVDIGAYTSGLEQSSVACLQYTGGTTGVSKAAMLSHLNLIINTEQVRAIAGDHLTDKDAILTALPLYHIFAFTVNFLSIYSVSAENVLIPNPRPLTNLRTAFEAGNITWLTGVNTLYNGLLNEAWFRDLPKDNLRVCVAGGTALQIAVAERWEATTGKSITEGYGLTETSPLAIVNVFGSNVSGSIGQPVPSTDAICVDEEFRPVSVGERGEVAIRGPQVMLGYWNRPEETAKVLHNGWLRTGDIGTMDTDGRFRIVDRLKDMIIVSGFNVFPNEVEDVLAKMPGLREAAVIGVPDGAAGEAVKAFVVLNDPSITAEAIRAYCKQNLTAYKVPKFVEFRDDLPKTNVGKVLRKDLRVVA